MQIQGRLASMGNRLSKIYTRTGDDGTTGLGDGIRVAKDSLRIEAIGEIDELNSFIGVILAHDVPEEIYDCLSRVQHVLFDIGGELSIPGFRMVEADRVTQIESLLDQFNSELEPLKEFILPGGAASAAHAHVARSVCRRAERRIHTLAKEEEISPHCRNYLNRLSDLLFVIARYLNLKSNLSDVLWDHDRSKPKFKKKKKR